MKPGTGRISVLLVGRLILCEPWFASATMNNKQETGSAAAMRANFLVIFCSLRPPCNQGLKKTCASPMPDVEDESLQRGCCSHSDTPLHSYVAKIRMSRKPVILPQSPIAP